MRARILPLVLILSAGCRSAGYELPPIERRGVESEVRAHSVADAERVAALADRLIPRVRAIKGVVKPAPPIAVCGGLLPPGFAAGCGPSMIVLGPDSRATEASSLAHELSHWFSDETWERLPYALDEGLADYVASLVEPAETSPQLQPFVFALPEDVGVDGFRSACEATFEAQADRPFEEEVRLRGIGVAAASAIGVEELRRLCARAEREGFAKIPFEWIHAALPFPAEKPGSFRAAIRRRQIAIDRQLDEERAAAAAGARPGTAPMPD